MSSSHDQEHDAWLREALRHAPDAQVVPPASVSELILREAQAKVRDAAPVAPAAPPGRLAAFWAWLGRPQVAAGAASLMIATVAGIMWWDRPLPVDDERSAAPVTAGAPAAAPPELAAASESGAAPAAAPAPAIVAPPAAPPAPERRLAKTESAAKRSLPSRDAVADQATPRAQDSAIARSNEPARRESAPETQPAPQPDEQRAAPRAFPAAPLASRAPAPAGAREREGFAAAEMQKSARGSAAAAAPFDVAALRQSIASEPWRWTWQRGAGSPQPVNDSLRNWLAQVDAAADWRQATIGGDTRRTVAADSTASRELRLWRDGEWVATLRLADGMLHWQGLATTLQSPLDESTQRSLQQSAP
jgi:hypothetical protein